MKQNTPWHKLAAALVLAALSILSTAETLPAQGRAAGGDESWTEVHTELLPLTASAKDSKGLFGRCGAWSAWTRINSGCRSAFRCVFRRQKASFHTEQRQRQCRRSIQVQTRTLSRCGC
jgi:hypothetical protein